jgi:HSP20 family protein
MLWRSMNNFSPPVDVIELSDHIIILVEVAGMRAEDFNISLANNNLVISGVRRRPDISGDSKAYHRVEIGFGEFRLDIPLSWSLQQEIASAVYRDGFLQVDLPRRPEKQIPIVSTAGATEQDIVSDDK